ncbi:alpha-ketoacid dehydrogenase subunit beta, partial [Burkholderia contaminans]
MARKITYSQAINEALAQEMARDDSVIVMGEDNAGGAGAPGEDDAWGGVPGGTNDLFPNFPGRAPDTPPSQGPALRAAAGRAPRRIRPGAPPRSPD